jgi:hypothetical protein
MKSKDGARHETLRESRAMTIDNGHADFIIHEFTIHQASGFCGHRSKMASDA